MPFLGRIIFSLKIEPWGLEKEPSYEDQEWFIKQCNAIESRANKLEKQKRKHMCDTSIKKGECDGTGHGGDEVVVYYDRDHCGPVEYIHRRDFYAKYRDGVLPSLPLEFNFRCERGRAKLLEGAFVMTADTKELIPLALCEKSNSRVYFKKRPDEDEITAGR